MKYMRFSTCMALFQAHRRVRRTSLAQEPSLEDLEKREIMRRLDRYRPAMNYDKIADSLGISKKTLQNRRHEYGLI